MDSELSRTQWWCLLENCHNSVFRDARFKPRARPWPQWSFKREDVGSTWQISLTEKKKPSWTHRWSQRAFSARRWHWCKRDARKRRGTMRLCSSVCLGRHILHPIRHLGRPSHKLRPAPPPAIAFLDGRDRTWMQRVTAESRNRELPGLGRTIRLHQLRRPSQLLSLILTPTLRERGGRRRQFDGVFPGERSSQAPPVRELPTLRRSAFDKGRVPKFPDVRWGNRARLGQGKQSSEKDERWCSGVHPPTSHKHFSCSKLNKVYTVFPENVAKHNSPPKNVAKHINKPQYNITSESYCSLRGDETLKLCPSAECPRMRSTDSKLIHKSATRWRQNTANKQLARMHTVPLDIKDNTIRVPTAVCRFPPPHFRGIIHSQVREKLKHVLQEEIYSPLNKRAIRVVPPEQSHNGFYSRYFLVPKKGTQALRPILDLRVLNKYLRKYKFRMLTHSTLLKLVRHGDWFTSIDLKDAYFHIKIYPPHRKFLRFAFLGVAYEYLVLPFGLSLSPRVFVKCTEAALTPLREKGIRLATYIDDWLVTARSEQEAREHTVMLLEHIQKLGLELNIEKSVLIPTQSITYLGLSLNSVMFRARLSEDRVRKFTRCMTDFQRGNSVSFRTCLRLLGLMASALIVVPLGRLFMREFQRWVASQGLDPLRHSRRRVRVTSEAVLALRQWRHPTFFGSRGTHGRGSSQTSSNNGRVVVRLGGHSQGQDSEWKMGSTSDQSSHKLFGNASRLSDGEAFPSLSQRASCSRENGQHYSCGLHKPTGRSQITSFAHVSTQTNFMEQCQSFIPESDARTGCYEQGCGSAVQGQSPLRGVEIEQGSGRTDLGHIRQSDRGSVRVPRQCSVSSVFLPERSERASGDRCVGARMASHSPLRVPTDSVDIPNTLQSEGGGTTIDINSSEVAREVLASGDHTYAVQRPVVSPAAQRSFITSRGGNFSSSPRTPGTMGLACEWFNLNTTGLSDSVIRTIQNARASSTRSLYECKWGVFERWCATKHEIPFQCSVAVVLSFLQDLIDQGKAFSTVKVYLAAISACHIGFDNKTVGQNPLICRFMKGARRALPVSKPLSPSWDLGLVLDALSMSPFEPLDKVDVKILSFKTALLLALASAKRVSEIHALSVHSACLQFMSGDSGVCLKPNPAFMPKILKAIIPLELRAFYPPPFASSEQQKLNALCPVRALRIYTERTREFRESDQLFVSWMKPRTGKPITKQRLSHWIVEAISLAYSSKGLVSPPGLRAHSTRGMSTSWALFKGVTLQDICEAASWTSPHTFARFYKLDVTAQTLAHAVLSVGMWVTSHDSFSPGCSDCGWQETSRQAIWQYGS